MIFYYTTLQLYIAIVVVFLVAIILLVLLFRWMSKRNMLPRALNMVALEVSVQREVKPITEEAKKEEKEIISVAEQMYANMHGLEKHKITSWLYGRDYLGFEIVSIKGKIKFYVVVPRKLKDQVERQIQAQYPKSLIEDSGDYNIFHPGYKAKGAYIVPKKEMHLPFKTYLKLEADPLNAVANSFSKIAEDEGAVLQMLFRPAKPNWRNKGVSLAKKMRGGQKDSTPAVMKAIGNFGVPKSPETPATAPQTEQAAILTPVDEEKLKSIDEKASKLGFEVCIRVVTSAKEEGQAKIHLDNIVSAFSQFADPNMNELVKKSPGKIQKFINNFIYRNFVIVKNKRFGDSPVFNTEELASIFHFPTKFTETPNIDWLLARDSAPPPDLPKEGLLLGFNEYRGVKTDIRIQPKDRSRHMYIIGQTGTGKSTIMENMAIQDIQDGEGVCVVDPHGEFVENILPHIPKERAEDVIIFDPSDLERPMGLNMLEFDSEDQRDFTVQEMLNVFMKLFPPEMIGPVFEHQMRNVMLTLMADINDPGTIVEIPRMFSDEEFQKKWVAKVTDPVVKAFWENEMAKTSDFHKSEMLGYMVSKVGKFVENEMMRNIMGQQKSAFNMRDIMDNGKILLVNLSKGKTGELNSSLLGLIIVSKIQIAAMARADMPADQRRPFYLYVDEFQNFSTDSFASILSEARKYNLNLIVAHQYISQLEENIRDAVFGNVGTMMAYRVGTDDSEVISKEFDPIFSPTDVLNTPMFTMYLRLMINSTKSQPFMMKVNPPPPGGSADVAKAVKELSRLKHAKDRKIVEADIIERAQLGARADITPPPAETTL